MIDPSRGRDRVLAIRCGSLRVRIFQAHWITHLRPGKPTPPVSGSRGRDPSRTMGQPQTGAVQLHFRLSGGSRVPPTGRRFLSSANFFQKICGQLRPSSSAFRGRAGVRVRPRTLDQVPPTNRPSPTEYPGNGDSPKNTIPSSGSKKRHSRLTIVLLPDPLGPSMAILYRKGKSIETARSAGRNIPG
jgi:hypothetical protein